MKYRIFSVLVTLVVTAFLCVVAAAPAGAQGGVTEVDVTLASDKAGVASGTCEIDLTGTWDAGDTIVIEFPGAFDLSELHMDVDVDYKYNNFEWYGNKIASEDLYLNGNKITITEAPTGDQAGVTFTITANGNLINPNVSQETGVCAFPCQDCALDSPYKIDVNGTESDPIEIIDWLEVDDTAFATGDVVTVTGGGFSPGMTVVLEGVLAGSGVVVPDGTVEIDAYATGMIGSDLRAEDGSGRRACVAASEFTLLPTITVTPSQGPVCTEVIIAGKDCAVAPVEINVGGNVLDIPMPTLQDLDDDGAIDDFKVSGVTIPRTLNGGTYDVNVVTDVTGKGSFNVQGKVVSVSPASGPPGTMVTIEGSGFCDNDNDDGIDGLAVLMYGNTPEGCAITDAPIQVDDLGNFTAIGEIPEDAPEGLRGVLVCFPETPDNCPCTTANCISAQGIFAVTDRDLTVVPESGPFGTSITIMGVNFGAEAGAASGPDNLPRLEVNYSEDPDLPTLDHLSTAGQMVPETFSVTADKGFHYGENIIRVIANNGPDGSGIDLVASGFFEATRPTLCLDKDRGPRGTLVKVSGFGWQTAGINFVTIGYEGIGDIGDDTVAVVQPNWNGDITAQFRIPAFDDNEMGGQEATLIFTASDGENTSLQSVFTVTLPEISVYPDYGAGGDSITVIGTGFLPLSQVQEVSIANAPIVPVYELGLTNAQGEFEVTGNVPGVMPGTYVIEARVTQCEGDEITCPFTVLSCPPGEIIIEEALASIEGLYTTLWTYDSGSQQWLVYKPGLPPWISILFDTLRNGQGYWICVTQDCTLTYGAHTYELVEGWNLIGWQG